MGLTRQEAEDYITKAVRERYLELYKEDIESGMTPLEVSTHLIVAE